MVNRSWLLMERAEFTIAEMVVQMSVCPPTPDLLRMATACIERVFSAMLRKAHEGAEVSGWHVGNVAMHDSQSLTPLLLDWHGNVVGSEFIGKFNKSLQCFVSSLPGLHSWGVEDTINEQPEPIQRHMLAWRGFLGTCGRSLVEFRVHFHSLPAQGHVGASECDRARSSSGPSSAAAASPAAPHALGEVPPAVGARPVSRSALAATLLSRLVPSWYTMGASAEHPWGGPAETTAADELPELDPSADSALTFAPLTATTWKPVVDALEEALKASVFEAQGSVPCGFYMGPG